MMNNDDIRLKEREAYVRAFNDTMVNIWKEKITLLGAIDTKALLDSVVAVRMDADGKFLSVELEQSFLEYGLYVDAGTGKEVSRGNPGDIGRAKNREAKPWFFKKHIASWLNLREFMSDNIGKEISDTVTNALTGGMARRFAVS